MEFVFTQLTIYIADSESCHFFLSSDIRI